MQKEEEGEEGFNVELFRSSPSTVMTLGWSESLHEDAGVDVDSSCADRSFTYGNVDVN